MHPSIGIAHAHTCYEYRMPLGDDVRLLPSPDAVSRLVDGEMVILDLASGTYFGLNEVGTRVWELLGQGRSIGEIRHALAEEFHADEPTISADVHEFTGELISRRLVSGDL